MAQTDAGGEGTPPPSSNPGERRPDNGLRGRADFTGNDSEDTPSDRNTRFIDTTLGILNYAQLAPHLAERVAKVSLSIAEGEFASWPLDETFILEIHRRICGDLVVLEPETPQARAAFYSALEAADRLDWRALMNIWRERLRFVDETLWPEFVELDQMLKTYLNEVTERVIAESLNKDNSDVEVRSGEALPASATCEG